MARLYALRYLVLLLVLFGLVIGAFKGIRAIKTRKLELPYISPCYDKDAQKWGLVLAAACIAGLAGMIQLLLD
jgi:hypothetical protein